MQENPTTESNLYIQESYVNATEGYRFGESEVYETSHRTMGELYRAVSREYGRCKSRVYIDGLNGQVKAVGWVFEKCAKYDDTGEPYLQETWITVHEAPPTKTIQYHYA